MVVSSSNGVGVPTKPTDPAARGNGDQPKSDYLHFSGVGVSHAAFWEAEDGRVITQVVKDAALSCELQRGSPEHRPLVTAVAGAVLMLPIFWLLRDLTLLLGDGNWGNPRYTAAMIFMVGMGAWLLIRAFVVKRYFVAIATRDRRVRLVFHGEANLPDIRRFLAEAATKYGWSVRDSLP